MSASPPTLRLPMVALLTVAVALAGCVAPPPPETDEGLAPLQAEATAPAFTLAAQDCEAGGFVAHYNQADGAPETLAEVWVLADIREEIGNPIRDSVGRPARGPMVGNWHLGFSCASVASPVGDAQDYKFGFVGDVVEAPEWDEGGADLHFLVSGLSFSDAQGIREALQATTTASITPTVDAYVQWYVDKDLPRSAAYVYFEDAEKGVYEGQGTIAYLRDVEARTIRIWWQVPADGSMDHHGHHNAQADLLFREVHEQPEGEWHPVYWDLEVSAARQYITPAADGAQWGSHNMLEMQHGPVLFQPTLSNVYHFSDLRFTSGAVVTDVVLTEKWIH